MLTKCSFGFGTIASGVANGLKSAGGAIANQFHLPQSFGAVGTVAGMGGKLLYNGLGRPAMAIGKGAVHGAEWLGGKIINNPLKSLAVGVPLVGAAIEAKDVFTRPSIHDNLPVRYF